MATIKDLLNELVKFDDETHVPKKGIIVNLKEHGIVDRVEFDTNCDMYCIFVSQPEVYDGDNDSVAEGRLGCNIGTIEVYEQTKVI